MKQLQTRECAMPDASLKRMVLSLEEDHAVLPEISVQENAEKNASCALGPRWSY